MRRPCGGMSFSAGEPGIASKENSSDDQRHPSELRIHRVSGASSCRAIWLT
jgi:hypothetical protein